MPATSLHITRRMLLLESISVWITLGRCSRFLCYLASQNRHVFILASIPPIKSQLRMYTFECFCEGLDYFNICVVLESHKNLIYWGSIASSLKTLTSVKKWSTSTSQLPQQDMFITQVKHQQMVQISQYVVPEAVAGESIASGCFGFPLGHKVIIVLNCEPQWHFWVSSTHALARNG